MRLQALIACLSVRLHPHLALLHPWVRLPALGFLLMVRKAIELFPCPSIPDRLVLIELADLAAVNACNPNALGIDQDEMLAAADCIDFDDLKHDLAACQCTRLDAPCDRVWTAGLWRVTDLSTMPSG